MAASAALFAISITNLSERIEIGRKVQDTADICVSNKFRQFAALSERNLATTFP
jgi:hypothetical protein